MQSLENAWCVFSCTLFRLPYIGNIFPVGTRCFLNVFRFANCQSYLDSLWPQNPQSKKNKKTGTVHQEWSVLFLLLILSVCQNPLWIFYAQWNVFHVTHNACTHTLRQKQSKFKLVDLSCCVWKIKSVLNVPESSCCGKAASYKICNRVYFFTPQWRADFCLH